MTFLRRQVITAFGVWFLCAAVLTGAPLVYAQDQDAPAPQEEESFWDFLTSKDPSVPLPARKPAKPKVENSSSLSLSLPVKDKLEPRDVKIYRDIFALIREGEITKAKNWLLDLKNGLLVGHAQAEILLHPLHKARFADLKTWLSKYADHPQAHKIYKLAMARAPEGESARSPGISAANFPSGLLGRTAPGKIYKPKKKKTSDEKAAVKNLELRIRGFIRKTQPTQAVQFLENSKARTHLDQAEYDAIRALIASGYFYAGYNGQAKKYAQAALKKSGKTVPLAGWMYGLAQWRDENYKEAAKGFELAASSSYASGWMVSAASYWAGRSHMRLSNHKKVSKWLEISAGYPRTFYGLVATRALGRDPVFDWSMPDYSSAHRSYISSSRHGVRAAALIEVGGIRLAEQEIKLIDPGKDKKRQEALVAFANYYNLPSLSYRLGNALTDKDERIYDAALYPIMPWEPASGYDIDAALVHAFVRQESKFHISAQSVSGAAGLMQLMPRTAQDLSGGKKFDTKAALVILKNPEDNLKLGQTYLKRLLKHPAVKSDLMSLAIAYNAGPGNLSRWKRERKRIDDPLLFIETVPFGETRAFVERVLANYWIYRVRMNQPNPTLEAVASGRWAEFAENGSKPQKQYAQR